MILAKYSTRVKRKVKLNFSTPTGWSLFVINILFELLKQLEDYAESQKQYEECCLVCSYQLQLKQTTKLK